MVLNWTPEVIINGLAAIISFLVVLIFFLVSKEKRIKSIVFIRLVFFLMGVYSLFEALADLFFIELFAILSIIILFPFCIFGVAAINYVIKDTYFSILLIIVLTLGPVFILLSIEESNFVLVQNDIYLYITNIGWAFVAENFFLLITGFYILYWGIETAKNAPFLIKREAIIFLIGIGFASSVAIILNVFIVFSRIIGLIAISIGNLSMMFILYSVEKEPKLLYVLPFVVYRIIVKDNDGYPLFDHDWSDSNINETLFSGFINAVQHMSQEVMNIGGLLDINTEEGIMILQHSRSITVGLVASKSSKMLRESLTKFTSEFESKFSHELKKSIRTVEAYDGAYELIEKYFSNFPYRKFKSRKQPLLISGEYSQIPKTLENRIRQVFPDAKDYEFIKSELIKTPLSTYSEFEKLYKELKDEMKKLSDDNSDYLKLE